MKQVGIYGGSFNPIHNGHIQLAKHILRLSALDEIWFMVSPQNPLKPQGSLLDDHLRLEMTRTALQNEPKLIACDTEFHLSKPSYTWNTLRHLSTEHPEVSFRSSSEPTTGWYSISGHTMKTSYEITRLSSILASTLPSTNKVCPTTLTCWTPLSTTSAVPKCADASSKAKM